MTFKFNELIHEERSKCLRSLPEFAGTVLSAGCAGGWYFDWFAQCTKHNGRHIGLELYSPKPDDLPANAEWVANSVENMESVPNESVDLIFSGQNVEHLSPSSLSGFLNESNRVLKENGLLIIDSPNRSVTEHLGYSQPEHTLELTVDEMTAMLSLAGFEIVSVRGIWLVIDPTTNKRMDIGSCAPGELSPQERCEGAINNPDQSFIWWVNARKKTASDPTLVSKFVDNVFFKYYKGFVSARFESLVGKKTWAWGSSNISLEGTEVGYALYGPYIPLAPGKYSAGFTLCVREPAREFELVLDVISAVGTVTHARRSIRNNEPWKRNDWIYFQVSFDLAEYTTGIEARCFVRNFAGSVLGRVDFLSRS